MWPISHQGGLALQGPIERDSAACNDISLSIKIVAPQSNNPQAEDEGLLFLRAGALFPRSRSPHHPERRYQAQELLEGWPEGYRELVFPGPALLMQNVVAKPKS